jgi:hypothetical protein
MSRRRMTDVLPSLVLAAVAAVYVWMSYDYDIASRSLPWIAGVLAVTLALVDVAWKRYGAQARALHGPREGGRPPDVDAPSGAAHSLSKEAIAFGWIGSFLPLVILLGFYAAILLYVFCYLRVYARKSGLASAVTAFSVVGVLYLVFGALMGYEIFGGLLAGDYL